MSGEPAGRGVLLVVAALGLGIGSLLLALVLRNVYLAYVGLGILVALLLSLRFR